MHYKTPRLLQMTTAQVAQSVEQRTENPRVGGSIPSPSTIKKNRHLGGFFCSIPRDFGLLAVSFRGELQRLLFGEIGFLLGR